MENRSLFFIAIIPPGPPRKRIANLKIAFANRYESYHALKSPPHITLVPPFKLNTTETDRIINRLHEFVTRESRLEIFMQGYGSFKTRVIYLNIEENEALASLQKRLSSQIMMNYRSKNFKAHLTIASRDLSFEMFSKAWDDYKNEPFTDSFEVDRLHLLKHDGKIWKIEKEFEFNK